MQLMPATAGALGVKNSFDPADNVDGGVRYLRELLLQYKGDAAKALAAYNAGPQRVQQYKGVPPYRETQQDLGLLLQIGREVGRKVIDPSLSLVYRLTLRIRSGPTFSRPDDSHS
jgi:hypothetical protein